MITVRIDVTKINKSHLFKGEKGTYLDIILIETPTAKYGNDFMVKQDCGKDNRDTAPILGNAKILLKPEKPALPDDEKVEDDLPF